MHQCWNIYFSCRLCALLQSFRYSQIECSEGRGYKIVAIYSIFRCCKRVLVEAVGDSCVSSVICSNMHVRDKFNVNAQEFRRRYSVLWKNRVQPAEYFHLVLAIWSASRVTFRMHTAGSDSYGGAFLRNCGIMESGGFNSGVVSFVTKFTTVASLNAGAISERNWRDWITFLTWLYVTDIGKSW